jgi:hypothetical protein
MTEAEQDAKRHRRRIAKRKQKLTKAFEMLREVVGTEAAKRELETLLGRAPLLGEILAQTLRNRSGKLEDPEGAA